MAVDLPSGKTWPQAHSRRALLDPTLKTLPTCHVHAWSGVKAVKYGCIGDRELFEIFESLETEEDLEKIGGNHSPQRAAENEGGGRR